MSTAAEANIDYELGAATYAPGERLATAAAAPNLEMVSLIVPAMNEERTSRASGERVTSGQIPRSSPE